MRSQKYVFSQRVTTKSSIVFRILFWSLLITCCYQLLFPFVGTRHIQYTPQWTLPISLTEIPAPTGSADSYLTPFWYNGVFGAIDSNGQAIHSAVVEFAVAYSQSIAVHYPHILDSLNTLQRDDEATSSAPTLTIQDSANGSAVYQLPYYGYPVVHHQQLYLLSSTGDTISAWHSANNIYNRSFASPILSTAISDQTTALSLFDGRVVVLDSNGVEQQVVKPNSQYTIAPAVAVSNDGQRMAYIAKGEQYALYYYDITEQTPTEPFGIPLAIETAPHNSFPHTHLQFIAGGYSLLVNVGNSLWIYHPTDQALTELAQHISLMAWDGNATMFCIIYEQFNMRMLTCYNISGTQLFSISLADATTSPINSLSVLADSSIVIGSNQKLYAIYAVQ